jgi:hypothetical protein
MENVRGPLLISVAARSAAVAEMGICGQFRGSSDAPVWLLNCTSSKCNRHRLFRLIFASVRESSKSPITESNESASNADALRVSRFYSVVQFDERAISGGRDRPLCESRSGPERLLPFARSFLLGSKAEGSCRDGETYGVTQKPSRNREGFKLVQRVFAKICW